MYYLLEPSKGPYYLLIIIPAIGTLGLKKKSTENAAGKHRGKSRKVIGKEQQGHRIVVGKSQGDSRKVNRKVTGRQKETRETNRKVLKGVGKE